MKWAILGHFHIFAHFFLKNGLKVRNYGNLNRKSIFPLYLTIIVVDQDRSFKKSESIFFYVKHMSFDHGAHCPKIGALVHIQILIVEPFLFLYTDSIDILNSLKVSFLW